MLSVCWTEDVQQLTALIETVNKSQSDAHLCHISVINSSSSDVISGAVSSLCAICNHIDPSIAAKFLPVSVPFHCPLLQPAVAAILEDCKRLRVRLEATDLVSTVVVVSC